MRKIAFVLVAASMWLGACATDQAGTVRLDAYKAEVTAQLGFKSLQQVALAGIRSGTITGSTKMRVIALIDQGQVYENQAYAAQATGGSVAAAVAGLTDIVAQLNALGIKGN